MYRWGFLFLGLISFQLQAESREQIQQRISPVGKVHSSDVTTVLPVALPLPQGVKKTPGQDTYEKYCVVCHRDGLAGAPKFRNEVDWKPRRAIQSLDALTATALKGLNAMPAKGTCQDCTEQDLRAAILYMVPNK